jgi:hypothetical protein
VGRGRRSRGGASCGERLAGLAALGEDEMKINERNLTAKNEIKERILDEKRIECARPGKTT